MAITASGIIDAEGFEMQFLSLRGQMQAPGERVEPLARAGVDGFAFRLSGQRADPVELVSTEDIGADYVAEWLAIYQALRGTLVTVVDDYGHSTANVLVLEVHKLSEDPVSLSAGSLNDGDRLLRMRWLVIDTGVPA